MDFGKKKGHTLKFLAAISLFISTLTFAKESPLSLTISSTTSTGTQKFGDPDKTYTNESAVVSTYKLSEKTSLSLYLWAEKALSGERQFNVQDGYLGVGHSIATVGPVSYSVIARNYIPLSKNSKDNTHLQYQFMIGPQARIKFDNLGVPGLTVLVRPYFNYYIHKFTTSLTGQSNTQYAFFQRVIIGQSFTDKISVSLDNIYWKSFTYGGKTKDTFYLDQSVSYTFNDNFSMSLGHLIGGSALAPDGQSSNIEIFDERQSNYYVGIEWSI